MKCISCNNKMREKKIDLYHYSLCGLENIYLKGISTYDCQCSEELDSFPQLVALHDLIATTLANKKNRLLPKEICFLRKHLGFSGIDFGRKIGVSAETVSRWERGSVNMKEASEKLLRVLVLARDVPFNDYEALELLGSHPQIGPAKMTFCHSSIGWVA